MDNGTLALLISPVAVVLTALFTQWVVRRNAREGHEIDRFEAVLQGLKIRIETLEDEVSDLNAKRAVDRAEIGQYRAELSRLRQIVRKWFIDLKTAWVDQPHPMPMPPDDDMEFLGITRPR